MSTINRKAIRAKVRRRIRRKVSGTASRPRLAGYFSNRHVYAQIIDDVAGNTLVSASSIADPSKLANCATATKVGNLIGERAKAANVTEVVFDRGGFKFCGKVKALADAARETGLKF